MAVILCGCARQIKLPKEVCPGRNSVTDSRAALRADLQNVTSIKGHGQCTFRYLADNKKKKENFPVKIWAEPPGRIYLQGDVAFNARGIILGANQGEFWLLLRPKEISGYWWGQWAQSNQTLELVVSPEILLEVLGLAGLEEKGRWSLSNDGVFDILTKKDDSDRIVKKIYIYCCDYRIRRVEYFNGDEKIAAVVELAGYKKVSEGFALPYLIDIFSDRKDEGFQEINIRLSAVKPARFNEKQRRILFTRPGTKGFKNVYRVIDGEVFEQP